MDGGLKISSADLGADDLEPPAPVPFLNPEIDSLRPQELAALGTQYHSGCFLESWEPSLDDLTTLRGDEALSGPRGLGRQSSASQWQPPWGH